MYFSFNRPRSDRLISGQTNPRKGFRIAGRTAEQVRMRLAEA